MKRYLSIVLLAHSFLWSQYDDIPYDWSGQYGVLSNKGQLLWNQDWQIGPLLIDGTFSNYPIRFGDSYSNLFNVKGIAGSYRQIHAIPDTNNISSRAIYYRGDFSYDQLEMDFNFEEKHRIIALQGFKRTYSGPYGQYAKSDGSTNPLHQSYRIDYSSKNNNALLDLSVGYFYTDSRLNLNDPADFKHKEKIATVGIGYSKEYRNWCYSSYLALFQQYYKMSYDTTQAYLNRININQTLARKLNNNSQLEFGIEFDNQDISIIDEQNINRVWSTLYGGWSNRSTAIKLGSSVSSGAITPYLSLRNQFKINDFANILSNLSYSAKPKHILYYSESDDLFEKWITAEIKGELDILSIPLAIDIYYAKTDADLIYKYSEDTGSLDISENLISSSFSLNLPLIRTWTIDLNYRHIFEHNLYSDGIGDRIKVGLNLSEDLFKNRLQAKLKLWADGYLKHNPELGYDGFHFGPYLTDNMDILIPDYWVFNLDFAVTVSKMTIGWQVNNILKTYETISEQIFPDLDENYLLITNSNVFPPMNRFVTLNIIWEFDN